MVSEEAASFSRDTRPQFAGTFIICCGITHYMFAATQWLVPVTHTHRVRFGWRFFATFKLGKRRARAAAVASCRIMACLQLCTRWD